ncbi:MAG: SDR family NAD(P)-dependent oxidoreductase [Acidimicrobiia bacterium]
MAARISLDGRVAIVTGAGNGLGRAHALELGRRGASVVVNDLGGWVDGSGASHQAADQVVAEIVAAGGKAVANYDTVATREGGAAIVATAIEGFGQLDVVVNNAGILRNEEFQNMTDDQLMGVVNTHFLGAYYVSQPAFAAMIPRNYGRFVFTSSGSGLFGLRNQANYCGSKAGIMGLSSAIALEGRRYGILSNAIAPVASTRIVAGMRADDIGPDDTTHHDDDPGPDVVLPSDPEFVSPMVAYLASEACTETQQVYSCSQGRFARVFVGATRGWYGPRDRPATAEDIVDHLDEIRDRADYQIPITVIDEAGGIRAWAPR